MKKILSVDLKIDVENAKSCEQKFKSNMPIVACTCGEKILVVPDLAAMDRAINNHRAKHKSADEKLLIAQIFKSPADDDFVKFVAPSQKAVLNGKYGMIQAAVWFVFFLFFVWQACLTGCSSELNCKAD